MLTRQLVNKSIPNKKNQGILVFYQRVCSSKPEAAKKLATSNFGITTTYIQKRTYALYRVTENESQQDPTKLHPTVVKKECDKEDCNKTNCAKTEESCDHASTQTSILAHVTHQESENIPIENTADKRGSSFVKVYEYKEPIEDKDSYEGYQNYLSRSCKRMKIPLI